MSNSLCSSCGSIVKQHSKFCQECGQELTDQVKSTLTAVSKTDAATGYVQIISVIEIAFGLLFLVIGFIIVLFGAFVTDDTFKNELSHLFVEYIQIVVIIIGLLIFIFGFLSVFFGFKLFQLQQLGRIGTMVICAINLINIPFGTIFGVLSLYVLVKPETIELFRKHEKK